MNTIKFGLGGAILLALTEFQQYRSDVTMIKAMQESEMPSALDRIGYGTGRSIMRCIAGTSIAICLLTWTYELSR